MENFKLTKVYPEYWRSHPNYVQVLLQLILIFNTSHGESNRL